MATDGLIISSAGSLPIHTVTETIDEKSVLSRDDHIVGARQFMDITKQFDGDYHWYEGRHYKNPTPQDVGAQGPLPPSELTHHRDILGRITQRAKDVLRYISPTDAKPSHMLVQATPQAFRSPQGDWRRSRLRGTAPSLILLSVWALGGGEDPPADYQEILWIAGKFIVCIPLQLCRLSWPFTRSRTRSFFYPGFPSRSWDYPKYARSSLDASPMAISTVEFDKATFNIVGEQERLLVPRQMIIKMGGKWVLTEGTSQPYIIISYTSLQFRKVDAPALNRLREIAEKMADEEKVEAYISLSRCNSSLPEHDC
ncbi:MAG: hypothetical protein MMC33_006573 [Icmadophila ericetorum]|nr:hypothetical protein [Icmadophila ericetorum]